VSKGRAVLLWIVIVGLLLSSGLLIWYGREGGIDPLAEGEALLKIIKGVYGPMLAVMLGFYLGERRRTPSGDRQPTEFSVVLALAVTCVALWSSWPLFALMKANNVEDGLALLDKGKAIGDSLAPGAIALFFGSRGSLPRRRAA